MASRPEPEAPTYTEEQRQAKLDTLIEAEGFPDQASILEAFITDSVAPAICMNDGCDYTTEMEQDQDRGWCEQCNTGTVVSLFILANMI